MPLNRLALSLFILGLLSGPGLLSQDYGAGRPEDIAAILPEEVALFSEVVRPSKLLRDWKEYVGAFCTKEGKANVVQMVEAALKEAWTEVPEKLLKDLEQGFPGIHRIAVAMGKPRGDEDPFLAIVASASGPALWKTLVDDLKVFAAEEHTYRGSTILVIRKLGRHSLDESLHVAAVGTRLVLSPFLPSVKSVIDRASGQGAGRNLLQNESYARLTSPPGEEAAIRAFADLHRFGIGQFVEGGRNRWNRRVTAHGLDLADAALGLRKLGGLTFEATLRPGQIAATTRLSIDPACPIYETWRQPAGPKDLLRFFPADTQMFAHLNLKGGTAVLADIQALVKRYEECEAKSSPEEANAPRRHHRTQDGEWKQGFEREMGVSIDEVAASISKEVAFAMIGDEAFTNDQTMYGSILFVVSLTDAEKGRGVVEKLIAKHGPYETKKEGEATFYIPGQEGRGPVFALEGKTAFIAVKPEAIRKALKTATEGTGIGKTLPPESAGASKILAFRHGALWSAVKMASRGNLPDATKDLDLSGMSAILFHEDKSELRLSSKDAGVGLAFQSGVMMMPVMVYALNPRRFVVVEGAVPKPEKRAPLASSPKLSEDQLAAEVRKHLPALRSDEVVAREDSELALRALGPQAARLLADAVRKESDPEVKGRLLKILSDWKAYDAFPELLKSKADGFLGSLEKSTTPQQGGGMAWYQWRQNGMSEFPWGMEPMFWNPDFLRGLEHGDLLEAPQGIRALAERITDPKLSVQTVRSLAAVFAFQDCAGAADLLLAAREKLEDGETRMFLLMALGWSEDAKAKGALYAGLKDADLWIRRAAFLGVEKSRDTAAIPKLLELLGDKDAETRWNASFTLRELTSGHAAVNVYLPEPELKASLQEARDWWEKNKATYRIGD